MGERSTSRDRSPESFKALKVKNNLLHWAQKQTGSQCSRGHDRCWMLIETKFSGTKENRGKIQTFIENGWNQIWDNVPSKLFCVNLRENVYKTKDQCNQILFELLQGVFVYLCVLDFQWDDSAPADFIHNWSCCPKIQIYWQTSNNLGQ